MTTTRVMKLKYRRKTTDNGDRVNADSAGISKELINDDKLFYKEYFFNSYKSTLLESTIETNSSKLFLTFSKPTANFLIAEILNFNTVVFRGGKYGHGVKMLFMFDSVGRIKSVLVNSVRYH